MRFIELKKALEKFPVFSLSDIKSIEPSFHRRRLNEWQEKGYIKKIVRCWYIFSDTDINENLLYEIANKIYHPSYVSFETALSYYNLIPESVYSITSATSRRTYVFNTSIAQFNYHTLKKSCFFGYRLIKYNGNVFKIANIEKAIVDYLYIHSDIKKDSDFASLRLNSDIFLENIDIKKLYRTAKKFSQKKLINRINKLMDFFKND